jgi:DNA-binding NarL/FixJ family response regulator
VILMDLNMPGMNGIAATREVLEGNPNAGDLVVTMLEDDDSVFATMRDGALGYLLKGPTRTRFCAPYMPSLAEKPFSARESPDG